MLLLQLDARKDMKDMKLMMIDPIKNEYVLIDPEKEFPKEWVYDSFERNLFSGSQEKWGAS